MADEDDTPEMEVRIVPDFTDFDREVARRAHVAGTFAAEGPSSLANSFSPERAGGPNYERVQAATDRLQRAIEAQAQAAERQASSGAFLGSSAANFSLPPGGYDPPFRKYTKGNEPQHGDIVDIPAMGIRGIQISNPVYRPYQWRADNPFHLGDLVDINEKQKAGWWAEAGIGQAYVHHSQMVPVHRQETRPFYELGTDYMVGLALAGNKQVQGVLNRRGMLDDQFGLNAPSWNAGTLPIPYPIYSRVNRPSVGDMVNEGISPTKVTAIHSPDDWTGESTSFRGKLVSTRHNVRYFYDSDRLNRRGGSTATDLASTNPSLLADLAGKGSFYAQIEHYKNTGEQLGGFDPDSVGWEEGGEVHPFKSFSSARLPQVGDIVTPKNVAGVGKFEVEDLMYVPTHFRRWVRDTPQNASLGMDAVSTISGGYFSDYVHTGTGEGHWNNKGWYATQREGSEKTLWNIQGLTPIHREDNIAMEDQSDNVLMGLAQQGSELARDMMISRGKIPDRQGRVDAGNTPYPFYNKLNPPMDKDRAFDSSGVYVQLSGARWAGQGAGERRPHGAGVISFSSQSKGFLSHYNFHEFDEGTPGFNNVLPDQREGVPPGAGLIGKKYDELWMNYRLMVRGWKHGPKTDLAYVDEDRIHELARQGNVWAIEEARRRVATDSGQSVFDSGGWEEGGKRKLQLADAEAQAAYEAIRAAKEAKYRGGVTDETPDDPVAKRLAELKARRAALSGQKAAAAIAAMSAPLVPVQYAKPGETYGPVIPTPRQWLDMQGLDPNVAPEYESVAEEILSRPKHEELISHIPQVSRLLGHGSEAIVFSGPSGKYAYRFGDATDMLTGEHKGRRPNVPFMLQAKYKARGNLRLEQMPLVGSANDLTEHEQTFMHAWAGEYGFQITDDHEGNYGRLPGGGLAVIDPGAVHRPLIPLVGPGETYGPPENIGPGRPSYFPLSANRIQAGLVSQYSARQPQLSQMEAMRGWVGSYGATFRNWFTQTRSQGLTTAPPAGFYGPTPLNQTGNDPLALPPMPGGDPSQVQRAWDIASARYPGIASNVQALVPFHNFDQYAAAGRTPPNAYYNQGAIYYHGGQTLQPSTLFHELTHVGQDLRGQLPGRAGATADMVRQVEAPAYSRGSAAGRADIPRNVEGIPDLLAAEREYASRLRMASQAASQLPESHQAQADAARTLTYSSRMLSQYMVPAAERRSLPSPTSSPEIARADFSAFDEAPIRVGGGPGAGSIVRIPAAGGAGGGGRFTWGRRGTGGGGEGGGGGGEPPEGGGSNAIVRRGGGGGRPVDPDVIEAEWEPVNNLQAGPRSPAPTPPPLPPRGQLRPTGAPREDMSEFYKRFLALEGLRTVTDIAYAFRDSGVRRSLSMGDPKGLAESDLRLRQDLASSTPFGIGRLAIMLRDPTGSEELGVRMPMEQAALADETTNMRRRISEGRNEMSGRANVASEVGEERTSRAKIAEDLRIRLLGNTEDSRVLEEQEGKRTTAARDAVTQAAGRPWAQPLADWYSGSPAGLALGWATHKVGINLDFDHLVRGNPDYSGVDRDAKISGEARKREKDAADDAARREAKARQDILNRQLSYGQDNETDRTLYANDLANGVPSREAQRNNLIRTQFSEAHKVRMETPSLYRVTLDRMTAELAEFDTTTARTTADSSIAVGFQNQALSRAIARNPLGATLSRIKSQESSDVLRAYAENPTLVPGIQENSAKQQEYATQQYRDQQRNETTMLRLQEQVTGMYAQAFGVGAREKRMAANVTNIAGQAEERAQEILQHGGSVTDEQKADIEHRRVAARDRRIADEKSGRLPIGGYAKRQQDENAGFDAELHPERANADRARRIGINELKSQRAQYIEGMTAQEGSLNRTALSSTASGNPAEILASIDKGIKSLTDKIGTLVAQD